MQKEGSLGPRCIWGFVELHTGMELGRMTRPDRGPWAGPRPSDTRGCASHMSAGLSGELTATLPLQAALQYECLQNRLGSVTTVTVTTQLVSSLNVRAYFPVWDLFFKGCTHAAYRSSQARGQIGAVAASLRHSHNNSGSEPRL